MIRPFRVLLLIAVAVAITPLTGSAAGDKSETLKDLKVMKVPPLDGLPARGAVNPKVTLIEFADYTCPFTIKEEPTVRKVVNAHADTVRFIIKHHWLAAHKHARLAAQVSVAADLQGKFWPVHEMMLDKHFAAGPAGASIDGFVPYLKTIPGLDIARLKRDVDSPEVNARVDRDLKEFKSTATPEFLLNGHFMEGQISEADFNRLIDEASR